MKQTALDFTAALRRHRRACAEERLEGRRERGLALADVLDPALLQTGERVDLAHAERVLAERKARARRFRGVLRTDHLGRVLEARGSAYGLRTG